MKMLYCTELIIIQIQSSFQILTASESTEGKV